MRPTQAELVRTLSARGFLFRSFQTQIEDDCAPEDVEWNYMDIVHPHFVHEHIDRIYTRADAEGYACFDVHRLAGLTIPQSVSTWVPGPRRMLTVTATFSFIIVVETEFGSTPDGRARTTATYQVGSASRLLLSLAFAPLKWSLKRNFRKFLPDDRRMRVRRGELRGWGYSFVNQPGSDGFASTLDIARNDVRPPPIIAVPEPTRIDVSQRDEKMVLVGRADHLGLQVVARKERLEIYPRTCPHEGACLDTASVPADSALQCPWHGRRFPPLVAFEYGKAPVTVEGPFHRFVLTESELRIEPLADAGTPRDWSRLPVSGT